MKFSPAATYVKGNKYASLQGPIKQIETDQLKLNACVSAVQSLYKHTL